MVGIVTNVCWKVEGHAQTGLPMLQEILVSLIRLFGRGKSCILTHGPEPPPIHGGLDSSCEWKLSGKSQLIAVIQLSDIQRGIEAFQFNMGSTFEGRFSFRRL